MWVVILFGEIPARYTACLQPQDSAFENLKLGIIKIIYQSEEKTTYSVILRQGWVLVQFAPHVATFPSSLFRFLLKIAIVWKILENDGTWISWTLLCNIWYLLSWLIKLQQKVSLDAVEFRPVTCFVPTRYPRFWVANPSSVNSSEFPSIGIL